MMLPVETALDFAIAKAVLILILSLATLAYVVRLALKIMSMNSENVGIPRATGSKPAAFRN
jgi:hypothetical protein